MVQGEPTKRLYLEDDHLLEAGARVSAVDGSRFATDQSCFYPGGGGQPPDHGQALFESGDRSQIIGVEADAGDTIWHVADSAVPAGVVGCRVMLHVDRARREALTRYHTVLHVLNTIALRDYSGWITGVQIGVDYSRIDFKLERFSADVAAEMAGKVNAVIAERRGLRAYTIPELEFRDRPDLLRTLEVRPPVRAGRVRVVEIEGFDAQACGGTHVANTVEIGEFSIFRIENKGKVNKRLYVRLQVGEAAFVAQS